MSTAKLLEAIRQAMSSEPQGLRIVKAVTANPVTFIFDGSSLALDIDVFEVPASLQPITAGSRYFTLPMVGDSASIRWGLLAKL